MSGIDPQPGPVIQPTPPFQTIPYQVESPLLVVKQRETWAQIDQQRFHDESLQWYGEECVVRLLWRAEDAKEGLVTYCQTCQDSVNPANPEASVRSRTSKVYRQTGNSYCPDCYGTTFTGGFKPVAYHLYMLANDTPNNRRSLETGQFWQENPQVQMSWFPEIRQGDLVIRITSWSGDTPLLSTQRYQVSAVAPHTIRTGPGAGNDSIITVNQTCTLETLWPDHPYYKVPFV
jgi:hypothetical protein